MNFQNANPIAWGPLPGSQVLLLTAKHIPVLLYHGGRGFGKTETLLSDFLQDVGQGYGSRFNGLFVRLNYPALKDAISKSKRYFKRVFPRAKFNEQDSVWVFPDGESLKFGYIDKYETYESNYHGHEYQWIGADELTTFRTLEWLESIQTTLRTPVPEIRLRMRFATNPMGPSHNLVKAYFRIDSMPAGTPFIPEGGGLTRAHIFGNIIENQSLVDTDYLSTLKGIVDPEKRRAHLQGDWTVKSGGIIDDIWTPPTHVLDPFDIPDNWPLTRAYDHGEGHPYSVGYYATAPGEECVLADGATVNFPRGTMIRFAEIFGAERGDDKSGLRETVSEIATHIKRLEEHHPCLKGRRIRDSIADGAIFQPRSQDDTGRQFKANGVTFTASYKGRGSREAGLSKLRSMLLASKNGDHEKPGFFVTRDCPAWIRVVPALPRDIRNPDDATKADGDDLYDETRYAILQKKPSDQKISSKLHI